MALARHELDPLLLDVEPELEPPELEPELDPPELEPELDPPELEPLSSELPEQAPSSAAKKTGRESEWMRAMFMSVSLVFVFDKKKRASLSAAKTRPHVRCRIEIERVLESEVL